MSTNPEVAIELEEVDEEQPLREESEEEDTPEDFECIICANLLFDPVVIPTCGHTCCKQCLCKWVDAGGIACPAGCKTKLQREVPATSVFIKTQIEKMFPEKYEKRRQEVELEVSEEEDSGGTQPIVRQNSFSQGLSASLSANERAAMTLRVYLIRCQRDGFYKNWRFWMNFFCVMLPLVGVIVSYIRAKPSLDEHTFSVYDYLLKSGISDDVADIFKTSNLHFFLKLDEESDFKEFAIDSDEVCHNLLEIRNELMNAMHVDFFEWRDQHYYVSMILLICLFYFAHLAVPLAILFKFSIPLLSEALFNPVPFSKVFFLFISYLLHPELFMALFFLQFSYTNPVFTFIIVMAYIGLLIRRNILTYHYFNESYLGVKKDVNQHLRTLFAGAAVLWPLIYILPMFFVKTFFFTLVLIQGTSDLFFSSMYVIGGFYYSTFWRSETIPPMDAFYPRTPANVQAG